MKKLFKEDLLKALEAFRPDHQETVPYDCLIGFEDDEDYRLSLDNVEKLIEADRKGFKTRVVINDYCLAVGDENRAIVDALLSEIEEYEEEMNLHTYMVVIDSEFDDYAYGISNSVQDFINSIMAMVDTDLRSNEFLKEILYIISDVIFVPSDSTIKRG